MKKILLGLLLALSLTAHAELKPIGTLGTVPTITIANRVMTDLSSNLLVLYAHNTSGAGRFATFRKYGATAGYQVTAGKTMTVIALRANQQSVSAAPGIKLMYSDNDVQFDSSTTPTNPVYVGNANAQHFALPNSIGAFTDIILSFPVIATKFLTIDNLSGNDMDYTAWAYEN